MGQRTISIPADVHELLSAQKHPGESFGDLLRRRMRPPANTCGELLERLDEMDEHLAGLDLERLNQVVTGRGRRSPRPRPGA